MEATINDTNIKYYLEQPEGETLEFKSKFTSVNQICSVISAFANTKGGILIIGFHERAGVIGVSDNENLLIKKAFSLLTNPPEYITYNVTINNKKLLIIEVKKNANSPTSFQGALLCRTGKSNKHMSTDKIKFFLAKYNDSNFPKELVDILSEMNQTNKNHTDEIKKLNDVITKQTNEMEQQKTLNSKENIKYCIWGAILGAILGAIISPILSPFISKLIEISI